MTMLNGARLVLRELAPDDVPAVHAYSERPEVAMYQPWGSNTPAESRAFVDLAVAAASVMPRTTYQLGVMVKDSGRLVGTAALTVHSTDHGQGEIGYFLHPDVWGRDYATEAALLLIGFGFAEIGLHRIAATCDPRNSASIRVLEKIGMTREGHQRETMRLRDGWRDSLMYSILAREWPNNLSANGLG